jgi:hypothetical protein
VVNGEEEEQCTNSLAVYEMLAVLGTRTWLGLAEEEDNKNYSILKSYLPIKIILDY